MKKLYILILFMLPAYLSFTIKAQDNVPADGASSFALSVYQRCKTGLFITIPDNSSAGITDTFRVNIPPGQYAVEHVYLIIDTVFHTWVGDLRIKLTKGATSVQIMRSPGTGIDGSSGDNFFGTKFSDTARFSIDSILNTQGSGQFSAPYTGWFRTNTNPPIMLPVMDSLAKFRNLDPSGTWALTVVDSAAMDIGYLKSWCLIIEYRIVEGVNQTGAEIPEKFYIEQNYPNPFNPTTNIKFGLPKSGDVKLTVYDVLGREAAVLVNEFKTAGEYVIDFDASALASGVYFYKLEAGDFKQTKKMLLVK